MELVDGIVAVSSSVGLQTLLWKKPLIVLGRSHLDIIADSHSLVNIVKTLDQAWPAYKERVLAWMLSHYYIPYKILFDNGNLANRILLAIKCASDGDYDSYYADPYTDLAQIGSSYEHDGQIINLNSLGHPTDLAQLFIPIDDQHTEANHNVMPEVVTTDNIIPDQHSEANHNHP